MMTTQTFDPKCWTLADDFIGDDPQLGSLDYVDRLAAEIQRTIEEFIKEARDNWEPPDYGEAWTGGFAENH